jgi:hypothetical protein
MTLQVTATPLPRPPVLTLILHTYREHGKPKPSHNLNSTTHKAFVPPVHRVALRRYYVPDPRLSLCPISPSSTLLSQQTPQTSSKGEDISQLIRVPSHSSYTKTTHGEPSTATNGRRARALISWFHVAVPPVSETGTYMRVAAWRQETWRIGPNGVHADDVGLRSLLDD